MFFLNLNLRFSGYSLNQLIFIGLKKKKKMRAVQYCVYKKSEVLYVVTVTRKSEM